MPDASPCRKGPRHAHPDGAANHRGIADHHQRHVVFPGEPRQADGDRAGQGRGTVEHHQAERAAPEQDVGAPGAPVGGLRAHHPEPSAVTRPGPLARGQRAGAVDHRHPPPGGDGGQHQLPDERRAPAAARPGDLRQPPARHPAVRQRAIQHRDPGGDRGTAADANRRQQHRQLLAKGGEGHAIAECRVQIAECRLECGLRVPCQGFQIEASRRHRHAARIQTRICGGRMRVVSS